MYQKYRALKERSRDLICTGHKKYDMSVQKFAQVVYSALPLGAQVPQRSSSIVLFNYLSFYQGTEAHSALPFVCTIEALSVSPLHCMTQVES